MAMSDTHSYARAHHPRAAERLQTISSACSDFSGGCRSAYSAVVAATECDQYENDNGVFVAKATCLLKGCVEHAIANLVEPGRTGWGKLRTHGMRREDIAA
eukprot:3419979-Lingulodinium_polyedra.AAC.1